MTKKWLLALALALAPTSAFASCTGLFGTGSFCGNGTASPNIPAEITAANVAGALTYTAPFTGAVVESQLAYNAQRVSIADFGAKGDTIVLTDGAITATSKNFTSASASFTTADVGKLIRIVGAGTAGGVLETTIAAFVSSTAVTTTAAASTTVSGTAQTFYGSDATTAIQNAVSSVTLRGNGSCILIPGKIYMTSAAITVPASNPLCLTGSGASIVNNLGSIIQPSITTHGILIQSADSVEFSRFGIFYAGAANTNTAAIKVTPPAGQLNYYSRYTHVVINNAYDGVNADRLSYNVFDGTDIQSFTHVGILQTNTLGAGDSGDVKIIGGTYIGAASIPTACYYWTSGGGLTFKDNKCLSTQIGAWFNPAAGVTTSQLNVQGNSFDGMTAQGVLFSRQDGTSAITQLIVSGNTCNLFNATAANCFDAPTDANGIGLKNLVISGNTVYGPSVANTMFSVNSVDNIIVGGNVMQSNNAGTNGIVIGSAATDAVVGANSYSGTFAIDWQNSSASYKAANAITPNAGGIIYSAADRLSILNGTATANLPVLSGNVTAPSWATISYPTSATSGGIPYFSSATSISSSAVLTANAIIVGGGAGAAPASSGCTIANGTNSITCSSASTFAPVISASNSTNDANASQITISKSRSGGSTNSGDTFGFFVFQGFANAALQSAAVLKASQAAASSGSNIPSKFTMATSNATGIQNQSITFDNNAHLSISGQATAPTISAGCNGAGSSISGGGGIANDTHGTVIGQTAAATTCTVSFGTTYTNAPDCVFSGFQSPITVINAVNAGSFQVTFASTANYKFSYHCNGT